MKVEAPSTNIQAPKKPQTSIIKRRRDVSGSLVFENSLELGA
jgi:hypothetical protein